MGPRLSADRAAAKAQEAVERVKRDYTTDEITAAEWRELRPGLIAEATAATSEAARLRDQEQAAIDARPEAPVLRDLADLRADIIGGASIEQVRAALLRLFEVFHLTPADDISAPDVPDDTVLDNIWLGAYEIWPQARPQVVVGIDEEMAPVLHRTPIHTSGQSDYDALPT